VGYMPAKFRVGSHVWWNSEAGRVSGKIVKVHRKNVTYKGYVRHASKEDPQYEIKSDKTDHVAMHKGSALRRVR
jgi:Hypervirulence associated proteins TUDOR domain